MREWPLLEFVILRAGIVPSADYKESGNRRATSVRRFFVFGGSFEMNGATSTVNFPVAENNRWMTIRRSVQKLAQNFAKPCLARNPHSVARQQEAQHIASSRLGQIFDARQRHREIGGDFAQVESGQIVEQPLRLVDEPDERRDDDRRRPEQLRSLSAGFP